jgi:hypothetical protein
VHYSNVLHAIPPSKNTNSPPKDSNRFQLKDKSVVAKFLKTKMDKYNAEKHALNNTIQSVSEDSSIAEYINSDPESCSFPKPEEKLKKEINNKHPVRPFIKPTSFKSKDTEYDLSSFDDQSSSHTTTSSECDTARDLRKSVSSAIRAFDPVKLKNREKNLRKAKIVLDEIDKSKQRIKELEDLEVSISNRIELSLADHRQKLRRPSFKKMNSSSDAIKIKALDDNCLEENFENLDNMAEEFSNHSTIGQVDFIEEDIKIIDSASSFNGKITISSMHDGSFSDISEIIVNGEVNPNINHEHEGTNREYIPDFEEIEASIISSGYTDGTIYLCLDSLDIEKTIQGLTKQLSQKQKVFKKLSKKKLQDTEKVLKMEIQVIKSLNIRSSRIR